MSTARSGARLFTTRTTVVADSRSDHIAEMLVAYFPRQKLLFEADLWDPISPELDIAGPDAVNLARRIRELGLQVERIIPVHGIPTTMTALDRALAVRAKYVT